jgi:hypothetical protein
MTEGAQAEELAAPHPPRLGWALAILLALAAVVGVIARVADSGSSSDHAAPAPAPTSDVRPTTSVHSVPYTPPPDRPVVVAPLRPAPPCPPARDGQRSCVTNDGLPAPVARALRAHLPGVVVDHAVTQILSATGRGLWSRDISCRAGRARVRIVISRAQPHDREATASSFGTALMVNYVRGRYLFQVQVRGAFDANRMFSRVADLMADPRLVRPVLARHGTMVR